MTTQETLGKVQNELSEAQLEEASGGFDSQTSSILQNAATNVIKSLGEGVSSASKQ